jgi:hypothetical protein
VDNYFFAESIRLRNGCFWARTEPGDTVYVDNCVFLAQEEKSFTELFLLGEIIHKIKK